MVERPRFTRTGHMLTDAIQKIPPRTTFAAQCCGIIVSWLTQTAVNLWAIGNVDGICTSESDVRTALSWLLVLHKYSN